MSLSRTGQWVVMALRVRMVFISCLVRMVDGCDCLAPVYKMKSFYSPHVVGLEASNLGPHTTCWEMHLHSWPSWESPRCCLLPITKPNPTLPLRTTGFSCPMPPRPQLTLSFQTWVPANLFRNWDVSLLASNVAIYPCLLVWLCCKVTDWASMILVRSISMG